MSTSRFLKTLAAMTALMAYGASAALGVPFGWVFGPFVGWAFYTFVNGEARWTR